MKLPSLDFESSAYTNFATPAQNMNNSYLLIFRQIAAIILRVKRICAE